MAETLRMRYLGCLGLLGECAVYVTEELREMIEQAMDDAKPEGIGWKRVLNRIEAFPIGEHQPREKGEKS